MNSELLDKYFNITEKIYLRETDPDIHITSLRLVPKCLCDNTTENIILRVSYKEKIALLKILKEVFNDSYRLANYFQFLINKTEQEEISILNFKNECERQIIRLKELNTANFGDNEINMEIEL